MNRPTPMIGANAALRPPRPRRRRRGGRLVLTILILFVALWCGYWFAAYTIAGRVISTAEAGTVRADAPLACATPAYGGFPLNLAIDCGDFTAAGPGFGARIAGLTASAPLYNPGKVIAAAAGPLRVEAPAFGLGIDAAWDTATASIRADLSGVARADSAASGLRVALSGPAAAVAGFAVGTWQGTFAQSDGPLAGMVLGYSAGDFRVADGRGASLPPIDSEGLVTLVGAGPIVAPDFPALLADWVARGGRIEVDHMLFASGTVRLAIAGPLSLSPQGLLNGALTLRVSGTEGLEELIATILPRHAGEAANIAGAVVALTQRVDTPAGPMQETRLTIRDGAVGVGFVPLFTIPPIFALR